MKKVHLSLQGKGGVGKSLIAALLAQYFAEGGDPAVCIDTDPVNATFAGYAGLNVEHLALMGPDKKISERQFDSMMERILTEDRNFVIDNGASSFVPLSSYLVENDAAAMIAENGKQLVVHSVVTGGQALADTVHGLSSLLSQMPASAQIVVWLNEYFGPIERDGRPFDQLGVYKENKDRIHGVVRLDRQTSDTFRKDLESLLDAKLTFAEALDPESDRFGLMPRQRLTQMRRTIFERIALVV
jgi:hypothetical protein